MTDVSIASPDGVAEAMDRLRERYGTPILTTDKMIAFAGADGREVAIQRDVKSIKIWVEGTITRPLPSGVGRKHYGATEGRHSNLPPRLAHQPPQGQPARPVTQLTVSDPATIASTLDACEGRITIDRDALELIRREFLAKCPDFQPVGFAGTHGRYFTDEREYKDKIIDLVQKALSDVTLFDKAALGARLLDIAAGRAEVSSNLLSWQIQDHLKTIRSTHPGQIETAVGALARANGPSALETCVDAIWPLFETIPTASPPGATRDVVTTIAALSRPGKEFRINTETLKKATVALIGRPLVQYAKLTTDQYTDVLAFVSVLQQIMDTEWNWSSRDLWDIQGFIWVVYEFDTTAAAGNNHIAPDTITRTPPMPPRPTNLILYGPPGTGKTYATAAEAVRLCDGAVPDDRAALMARYKALSEAGQIGFVTFHQSYSYEDFVEGLRPTTGAEGEAAAGAGFRLEARPGVFREIAALATQARQPAIAAPPIDLASRKFFKMSLGRAGVEDHVYQAAIEGDYIALGWGGDVDWSDPRFDAYENVRAKWNEIEPGTSGSSGNIAQVWCFRGNMREGDIVVASEGNSKFRAIGQIVGPYVFDAAAPDEYKHKRAVRWLLVLDTSLPVDAIYGKNFTTMSCYQLADALVREEALARLLAPRPAGPAAAPDQFVLVVDEINRANISKVFGELITLLEPDKRLGEPNELRVKLPYSNDLFGVPANLHVIGTMNTADRSIALLDTALRRRFAFRELMPDPETLRGIGAAIGLDLARFLAVVNERIEYLFDRDHQIGHAYLLGCRSRADVDDVVRHKVIPLLAEYFYEDWSKVAAVLGDPAGERFLVRTPLRAPPGADGLGGGPGDTRDRWMVRSVFAENAYETVA